MPPKNRSYWLTLIVSMLSLLTGTLFVVRHITAPSDGARLAPGANGITPEGIRIQVLRPQPGSLQTGDLVIAVEDQPLEETIGRLPSSDTPRVREAGGELTYQVLRDGQVQDIRVTFGQYPTGEIFLENWGTIVFGVAFLLVGGFVFIRKPGDAAGRILFLSAAGLAGSTAWSFGLTIRDILDGTGFWLFKAATFFFYNLAWTAGLHFALIFPRPFNILKRRWFIPLIYIAPFALEFAVLAFLRPKAAGRMDWFALWPAFEGLHAAVFLLATVVMYVFQWRRAQHKTNRQQIRWVLFSGLISGGLGLLLYILPPFLGIQPITPNLVGVLVLTYPVSVAIAILRHNLFDIETIINRTLVYGALTASTMLFYILVVSLVGGLIQVEQQNLLPFITTGIVALLFQPLRNWLQGLVNRFMYGAIDDPYSVLQTLGQRLQSTLAPGEVIPIIVETVAEALNLPYAGIRLNDGEVIDYGVLPSGTKAKSFSLAYQGENFGRLEISPRSAGEPLTDSEINLIHDLARQIEVAVHDVRLNADLQRSRQRLVTAREEERRRIRRDLHDGLGPQLASQMLTLEAMDKLLERDPEATRELLRMLKTQSQDAITDIRSLIYGLRPPALDDLGLIEALNVEFKKFPSPPEIRIQSSEILGQLPAAVELAIFRIAQEGVNNVVRHAQAEHCTVQIRIEDERITLTIRDDGRGLPSNRPSGVGMQAMRERAEELGGKFRANSHGNGTMVTAILPFEKETS